MLSQDGTSCTVSPVGAALRSLDVNGRRIITSPSADDAVHEFAGSTLAPWPNRVRGGRWEWKGRAMQLTIDDEAHHAALHGLVASTTWHMTRVDHRSVALTTDLAARDGYPFALRLTTTYSVAAGRVDVEVSAVNVGTEAAPVGLGSHPYFAPRSSLEDVALRVSTPDAGELRKGRRIAGAVYDIAVRRDGGSSIVAEIRDGDSHVRILAGQTCRWLMIYTADTLAPARRRTVLAIEPMTCPPDALNSHTDLDVVDPGEELVLQWSVDVILSAN